jgi:hypothetical protein
MGSKAPMQQPPPMDLETDTKLKESEARLEKERQATISGKQRGRSATILTSGRGLEEEAPTSKTMLGGSKPIY